MQGTWSLELLAGKPAHVYEPGAGPKPRFGILFLHPVGQETLVGRTSFTRRFDELRLACVCPHGGLSWWADRVCRDFDPVISAERHVLDQVVPFFDARWGIKPRAIGLLGISMGGQGALRMAFRHPAIFPVAAGIASALDYHELYGRGSPLDDMYDSKEQCRQDTALLHVPPHNPPPHIYFCCDPTDVDWQRGNDRLHEKLTALGIEHVADLTTEAGGHSWAYFDRMAGPSLRFVYEGLLKESRRLA